MKFESRQALSLNQVPMNRADNIQHDKVALCCAVRLDVTRCVLPRVLSISRADSFR